MSKRRLSEDFIESTKKFKYSISTITTTPKNENTRKVHSDKTNNKSKPLSESPITKKITRSANISPEVQEKRITRSSAKKNKSIAVHKENKESKDNKIKGAKLKNQPIPGIRQKSTPIASSPLRNVVKSNISKNNSPKTPLRRSPRNRSSTPLIIQTTTVQSNSQTSLKHRQSTESDNHSDSEEYLESEDDDSPKKSLSRPTRTYARRYTPATPTGKNVDSTNETPTRRSSRFRNSSPLKSIQPSTPTRRKRGLVGHSNSVKRNDYNSEFENENDDAEEFDESISPDNKNTKLKRRSPIRKSAPNEDYVFEEASESSESESDFEEASDDSEKREIFERKKKKAMNRRKLLPKLDLNLGTSNFVDDENLSDFEKAMRRLHVSTVPLKLACREEEFLIMYDYIASALYSEVGSVVFVSGVPGTGKTATFRSVIRQIHMESASNESEFDLVEINGMKLLDPRDAYTALWQGLTGERTSPTHAETLLAVRFENPADKPTVVLVDELDLMVTKKQSVVYNLFNWANLEHSKLIIVAIANTMDLPERMLSNKVASRIGLNRMSFLPYSHVQLIEIIKARLENLTIIESDAVEFCARRIGSIGGDARRCLDVCRRAVEILVESGEQGIVTRHQIGQAIKEMNESKSVLSVQYSSLQQKVFLLSVILNIRKVGINEVVFADVAETHVDICINSKITIPTTSELYGMCGWLGEYKLLICDGAGKGDPQWRIKLGVEEKDILAGLNNSTDKRLLNAIRIKIK